MAAPRSLRVRSGDIELAVRLWDNPGRPTLVLVHGYPNSQDIWSNVIKHLTQRYRIVTYDVRGAGESDIPARTAHYKLKYLADDLKAVTDAVCPDQSFHLVAHDWGSIQSWESVTEPSMQSRIASYTTISGPCLDHAGFWLRQRLWRPSLRNWAQLFGQLLYSWYIYVLHLPWLAPLLWQHVIASRWPAIMRRIEGIEAEANTTQVSDGVHGIKLYRANIFQRLFSPRERYTTVPVQVIVPMADKYVRPGFADDLSRWAPRLLRRDVQAGHWTLLFNYASVLSMHIGQFVELIEQDAPSYCLNVPGA